MFHIGVRSPLRNNFNCRFANEPASWWLAMWMMRSEWRVMDHNYRSIAGWHPQSAHHFSLTTLSASLTKLTWLLPQLTWLQLLCKQTITGTSIALITETHLSTHTHNVAHSPDSWHQSRLGNVTCGSGWRLWGINPAILCRRELRFLIIPG